MKPKLVHVGVMGFSLIITIVFFYFCCKKDSALPETPPSSPPQVQNLIANSSFEQNGQPAFKKWYGRKLGSTIPIDSLLPDSFLWSPTPAPDGGQWALYLSGDDGMVPGTYANAYITGISGTNIYHLTAWMKVIRVDKPFRINQFIGIGMGILKGHQLQYIKSVSDTSVTWKQYILTDTLTTVFTDTIAIYLTAHDGGWQGPYCDGVFDLINLTQVQP